MILNVIIYKAYNLKIVGGKTKKRGSRGVLILQVNLGARVDPCFTSIIFISTLNLAPRRSNSGLFSPPILASGQ